MSLFSLLSILLIFVSCTYGDVTYSNTAVGFQASLDITFTYTNADITAGTGADIYVSVPTDFRFFGETVQIVTHTLNYGSIIGTPTDNPLRIAFHVTDDIIQGSVHSFTIANIYSPQSATTSAVAVTVDVRPFNSMSPNNPVSSVTSSYISTGLNFGYQTQVDETTAVAGNTYIVAGRSYLSTASTYTISSIQLHSFNQTAFVADSSASLKIFTRGAGASTLTFVTSFGFTINAGASPQTINFNNARPVIPSNAVIGIRSSNNDLSLSNATAPHNFGGHYVVVGNAAGNVVNPTLVPQDLAVVVTRAFARSATDLSGLTVSTGTLSPAFATNVPNYAVNLPYASGGATITVTPTVDASTGATVVIDHSGPTVVAAGSSTIFTITVSAEDPAVANNIYTVNVTVAGAGVVTKPPYPCFALIGTLNRVGVWSGTDWNRDGVFDYTTCLLSVPNVGFPPTLQRKTGKLTISTNYLRSGMFFGILVAGALPDPLPLSPPKPITPFSRITALFFDQFGQNRTLSPSGGQFNFPNPDLAGDAHIILTGIVDYAPTGETFTVEYDITVTVQRASAVRDVSNSGGVTRAVAVRSANVLPQLSYGQFAISLATALGGIFDPWRILVMSSGVVSGRTQIVIGFIDNQDPTRVSTASSSELQSTFIAAVNNNNNPYNAKLRTLAGDFALVFSSTSAQANPILGGYQITPCQQGLWFFKTSENSVCGSVPDPTSSDSSNDNVVLADALVGLFVGGSFGVLIGGYIYYKWIAKNQPADTTAKSGMGMELNETAASAPAAIPAAQLTAETTTGDKTDTSTQ